MCSTQGEWVVNDSKENKELECPLRNDGETLQRPCVTVTQEGCDSSTEIKNDKWAKHMW